MKIVKYVLIGLGVLIVAFLGLGLIIPREYTLEKTALIDCPKAQLHSKVSNLRSMNEWSPWADYDPDMKNTYQGEDGQVGSVSSWEGNDKVGKGKQEITSITTDKVETKLSFIEPWESEATSYILLKDQGDKTEVTWGMKGQNDYPFNAMSVFMDMDDMIGKDFERGLDKLKVLCKNN